MNTEDFRQLKVSVEQDGALVVVALDHGKVNACGSEVIGDFERLCEQLENDTHVRGLLMYSTKVSGSGKPIFVAGADVTERVGWSDEQVKAHVRRQREALLRMRALPVFTVVVVNGLALGLGTELMLAFDYRIATGAAAFALPETGLGIIPGALGSSLLSALVGPNHALRLGCTGERVKGKEAARIGLVDELHEGSEAALERARALLGMAATKAPRAVAAFKTSALAGLTLPLDQRVALEAERYEGQVDNGDAAIGRESFQTIRSGGVPAWPPRPAGPVTP